MAPPPDLADDAISEILLRLPPDEPQWLFRAALVCKPWLRTLSHPAFLRRYRDFHGAPPLLGVFYRNIKRSQGRFFFPTTAVPAFPIPESMFAPHDCRHGRVVFSMWADLVDLVYLVCDPITGDRHHVPYPQDGGGWSSCWPSFDSIAVFCAAAGCDHLDCHHGGGPFSLVSVYTDCNRMLAVMYSSEIGAWSAPAKLDNVPLVPYRHGPLIGDEIYFALPKAATIVKYYWANNVLSLVQPQPPAMHDGALMLMEDRSLGIAGIEDSRLRLWSRRVTAGLEGAAEWVQCRVIDLDKSMPMARPRDSAASVVGFAEGVGIIFVRTAIGLFMMDLKSKRVRKVDMPYDSTIVLPYMSFYTPDRLVGGPADL